MKRYDLNLLYAIDALSRTGSVKAAAEMLNLSPPAMSHTLARLRQTTGDPLLVRAGRKLVPTPRALSMIEVTRELVAQAQAVLAPTTDERDWTADTREFFVSAPDELSVAKGLRLLNAIRTKMPNAKLTLLKPAHGDFERMRLGSIDVEMGPMGKAPPEFNMELLRDDPMVVAMHQSHDLAGQKMTLARYASATHVCQAPGYQLDDMVERALAETSMSRTCVLRVTSTYAALAAAAHSDMLATAPRALVESVAESLGLVFVTLPLQLEKLRIVQTWHPRLDLDPQHVWLRTCIRSVFTKNRDRVVGS